MQAAEQPACNASECNYSIQLDKAGFYIAVVSLPTGQKEGVWSLIVNPPSIHRGSFHGGGIMKEGNTIPSWVAFSLAQADVVSIDPFNYPTDPVPFGLELLKEQGNNQYQTVWGPTLVSPGQRYTTSPLEPGFYVALSSSVGARDFYGLSLWSPGLFGGVSGGYLDSQTGVGFGAFDVAQPQTVNLKLLFGGSYGESGVSQPQLEVYYQKADGTRELYWSAPRLSSQEPTNIDPIFVSQVTDPNVELGFIGTTGKETMGIFGTKDSQGRLVSINRITFGSQTDENQSLSITLDADYLPATMEFPDGSKIVYSNYTNDGATATFYSPDGSVANQAFVKMSVDDLRKGAEAIKNYVESPQPTVDSFMPSTRRAARSSYDDCFKMISGFHRLADGLIWGVSQIISIVSCATSAAAAVGTFGGAAALAVWSCGSVVLNGVAKIVELTEEYNSSKDNSPEDNSPIVKLNRINSIAQTVETVVFSGKSSCIKREWGKCALGVAGVVGTAIGEGTKGLKPEEICDGVVAKFSGSVTDMEQNPIGSITIKLPLNQGDARTMSANGDYSFEIPASNKQLPDFFVISASGEAYIPVSKSITKTGAADYRVDFVMEKISDDVVVLELEPNLHHLGNDSFKGPENSQFQKRSEGGSYTKDFEVNDFQLSFAQAEISLLAKGLQQLNTISVNGWMDYLDSSPSDGSFTGSRALGSV